MKGIVDAIVKLEMIATGLFAIACYGRYNYYKGRISKTKEMQAKERKKTGYAVIIDIEDV